MPGSWAGGILWQKGLMGEDLEKIYGREGLGGFSENFRSNHQRLSDEGDVTRAVCCPQEGFPSSRVSEK